MAPVAAAALMGSWAWSGPRLAPGLAPAPAVAPAQRSGGLIAASRAGGPGAAAGPPGGAALGLQSAVLALLSSAAWRRAAARPGSGRVVVRGRNYECNIKNKKGPAEAKKARVTARHLRKIIVAVRESGPDEETNPTLPRLVKAALKDNVPRSTIDARIKKFVEDKEVIHEMNVGGYSVGGAAVMVQCVTDNTNRARMDVKEAFKEAGGQIGTEGCVDHCFNKQGVILFEGLDEETVVEASMEAEVEDCVARDDGVVEVTTLPENFHSALKAFEEQGLEPASSEVEFSPVMSSDLNDQGSYEINRLLHLLRDLDDVQDVQHNAVIKEGTLELKFSPYGIPLAYEKALKAK